MAVGVAVSAHILNGPEIPWRLCVHSKRNGACPGVSEFSLLVGWLAPGQEPSCLCAR